MTSRRKTVAVLLALLPLAACGPSDSMPPATEEVPRVDTATKAIAVEVVRIETIPLAETLVASGTIAAAQTSDIGALAEGLIDRIFVKVGDRVAAGSPLFRTRQIDYQRRLDEALAQLEVTRAEAAQAKSLVERYEAVAGKGLLAGAQLDDAETAFAVAEAKVHLAQVRLETARQALADTLVRAPFDGAVTMRFVDEGVYMTNRSSGAGQSAVVQLQECDIAAGVLFTPESDLSRLRLGLKGRLWVDGRREPIESEIHILNDRVDPASRMVEFRMGFRNPHCPVKAGQSVRAEVDVDPRAAWILPRPAVHGPDSHRYVYVVRNGHAEKQSVQVADIDADRVEILSGLAVDDPVVLSATEPLYELAPVEPRSE